MSVGSFSSRGVEKKKKIKLQGKEILMGDKLGRLGRIHQNSYGHVSEREKKK